MCVSRSLSLDNIPKDPLGVILSNCTMGELSKVSQCNMALRKATYAYKTKFTLKSNPLQPLIYQQYAQIQCRIHEIDASISEKRAAKNTSIAQYYTTMRFNPQRNYIPYENTVSFLMGAALGFFGENKLGEFPININYLTSLTFAIYYLIERELPHVINFSKNLDYGQALMINAGMAMTANLIGMNQTFNYAAGMVTSIVIKSKMWLPQENTVIFDLLHDHYINSFGDNFCIGMIGNLLYELPLNLIFANSYLEGLITSCTNALKAGLVTGTISAVASSVSTIKNYLGMRFFVSRENKISNEISSLLSEKRSYAF